MHNQDHTAPRESLIGCLFSKAALKICKGNEKAARRIMLGAGLVAGWAVITLPQRLPFVPLPVRMASAVLTQAMLLGQMWEFPVYFFYPPSSMHKRMDQEHRALRERNAPPSAYFKHGFKRYAQPTLQPVRLLRRMFLGSQATPKPRP